MKENTPKRQQLNKQYGSRLSKGLPGTIFNYILINRAVMLTAGLNPDDGPSVPVRQIN
jgi:hypothetical protein